MTKALDQDFEAAYERAKKLTVFWCPLIDRSEVNEVSQKIEINDIDDLIDSAKELLSPNSVPLHLAEQMSRIYAGIIPSRTIAGKHNLFLKVSLGEDTDDSYRQPQFGAKRANLQKFPETYGFCLDAAAQTNISFGLWQQRDDWIKGSRWTPEVNICRTYSEKPQRDAFRHHLETYRKTMGQAAIHFKLDEQSWFYDYENGPRFEQKKEVNWTLTTTQKDPWTFQFRAILERLNNKYQTGYPKMVLSNLRRPDDLQNLGATIEGDGDHHTLRLSIGGCSSYLFRPFFAEVLNDDAIRTHQSTTTIDYTNLDYRLSLATSDAILLNVKSEASREVLYAFYSDDMDKSSAPDRGCCLCGRYYPSHGDFTDSIEIANLRREAAEWIKAQYKLDHNNRGKGWRWWLLSSPHFYFARDPALLADDNKNEAARKQCEDEALSKAKNHWHELMTDFFEGSNQNDLNPPDEKPPQQ